ncbi:MAG: ribonuclease [Clostridium sp.]|nr:ribonuclease [Clostridium sp.]
MKSKNKIISSLLVGAIIILSLLGFEIDFNNFLSGSDNTEKIVEQKSDEKIDISEDGYYTSKEDVYKYIDKYEKLPNNYITKKEAKDLGWDSKKGNLWDVSNKKSIGGDYFGNRENKLPDKNGRKWYECDINYNGGYRGKERIVFSNDGQIYYTDDHYNSFIKLSD